ncbi:MAG: phage tail tube protein, partial [Candidatus Woesearchaeota archaeon]
TAAVTSGASGTFTTVGANWLTLGFKVGMVVNWTGWATTGVPNNSHNFLITALSATVMTGTMLDGVAVGAKAAGDSVTAVSSKYVSIPLTAHTKDYWTIEHVFTDITQAEQFKDCVFTKMDIKLPPTAIATVDFNVIGLDVDYSTSAYFTTPTAVTSTGCLAAVNGALYVSGVKVGTVTGFDVSIDNGATAVGAVVGANVSPDVTSGISKVTGNATVLFENATLRDMFNAETEASIIGVFTASNLPGAAYQSIVIPRLKFGGASIDDGVKALTITMPYTALLNSAGGTGTSSIASTITIYDSAFA